MLNGAEVGNTNNTSRKLLDNVHSSAIFTTSIKTTATNTPAITTTIAITTTATTVTSTSTAVTDQYFKQYLSSHVSPHSKKIIRGASSSTHEFSDDRFHDQPRYVSDNLCGSKPDISAVRREKDIRFLPVEDKTVVYHPGHYEEEVIGSHNRRLRRPPSEPDDDFVLVHRPKLGSTGKIFHQNGAETDILVKEEDIETYPIRPFADVNQSDSSRFISGKKNFEVFEKGKYFGTGDVVDKLMVDKGKYPTNENFEGRVLHTERSTELPTEPLRAHAYVYNQEYYDTADSSRTDIDEKGNVRNWLRCYKKPEKSQAKLLKEKSTEVKEKTGKSTSKLVNGDHAIDKSGSVDEQESKIKKTAVIHVKQPGYEKQTVQASYYNAKPSEKELQRTAYLKGDKPVTIEAEANKTFGSGISEKAYGSTQPKQTYHFVSTPDSYRVKPGTYGVPSTSYDELLYSIRREEELPSLPIREHATVYHPGMSVIKDKERRKFLIQKERQKATSSETSTDEEVQTDKGKKWTAVLDISRVEKNDLTNAGDVEKRPIKEEIARKHMTYEVEKKEYLNQVKDDLKVDSEMQKSMQEIKDKKRDTKLGEAQSMKSESARQKMKAILHLSEGQSKSSNAKKETIPKRTEESQDIEHTIRPTYNILGIGKSAERSKKTELLEQSHSEHILDNTPPPVKLSRVSEISFQPLHLAVKVQNQVQNLSHNYRTFKRAKHRGTVEFVAKENINPESYKLESAPYQGHLETTNFVKGLQFAPIHEYSAVYHPGNTYVKSRKVKKRKNASEFQNEEKSSTLKTKKTAALYLNKNDSDAKHHKNEKSDSDTFLSKNDDQVTTYAAKIICKPISAERRREAKKHPFRYRTVSGDVEIVEKSFVKPETYNLVTVPYDGPTICLEHGKELSFTPLRECVAAYHSGISHKKAKRLSDSSSESSSSTTFSSGSSTSSIYISEKYKEPKKKVILHVTSSKKRDASDIPVESPKHKGIFSFWRKSIRSEKEGSFSDDKKERLEGSPKPHLIPQQQSELSTDFTASQAASSPSQMISTVVIKDSVEEPRSNLHMKSESKKMSANLHLKKDPLTTSECVEDDKRGKFDLFHFWRSTDKESKLSSKNSNSVFTDVNSSSEGSPSHTNFDSSHEETNVRLTTKGRKKPIIYVTDKDVSTNVETSELTRSIDMKEESLNHSSASPSGQSIANVETKKNAVIYLKRDSELSDNVPLNLNISPGISRQEITTATETAPKTNEDSKSSNTGRELQSVDSKGTLSPESVSDSIKSNLKKYDKHGDVGYIARIKVKREMRNADEDLQQDSNLKAKRTGAVDDGISKRSSFVVKGFHLRGPPCDSGTKIATQDSTKYEPEKNAQISEAIKTGGGTITEMHKPNSADSADKSIAYEEVAALKIRKKLARGDVVLKENKKDNGKNTRGSLFSSLWRGNKSKGNGHDEHQKQQKLMKRDVHGTSVETVETTSPADESQYNILRTEDVTRVEGQTRQNFVPVYDFSYVPNFSAFIEEKEVASGTTAGDVKKQIELVIVQDLPGTKPDDGIITDEIIGEIGERRGSSHHSKDVEECSDMPPSSEDQSESWRQEQSAVNIGKQTSMNEMFASELTWEKLDTETEGHRIHCTKPETFVAEKLSHRTGISGGETSDEPCKFTEKPPDISVLVAHPTDPKKSGGVVEQINLQVTQVCSI